MNHVCTRAAALMLTAVTLNGADAVLAQESVEDRPSAEFHRGRRAAVQDALPEGAVAIVLSAPQRNRSNDVEHEYQPSRDLYYLTGVREPASALVLVPGGAEVDGRTVREILIVPERDARSEMWTGRRLGPDGAMAELGVELAVGVGRFGEVLDRLLEDRRVFLLPWPEGVEEGSRLGAQVAHLRERIETLPVAAGRDGFVQRAVLLVSDDAGYERTRSAIERLGGAAAVDDSVAAGLVQGFLEAGDAAEWTAWKGDHLASYADQSLLPAVLADLRAVKTSEELEFLQKAIDITAAAHREAFRSIEPGRHEYEIEAVIEYVFHREGAEHPGFPSIVGSGPNSIVLHYESNRRRMKEGDLVVMDIGAEYRGYTADVTRTVPVSGTFSEPQEQIYRAVLDAQEAAIAASRPGASFRELSEAASRVLAARLQELGLVSSATELPRFFPHGVSHYLGLDVHDVGSYGPLRPGNVITIEPGIYIAPGGDVDEKWWNIGVRIEDDVLITEDGPRVLSTAAPKEVGDIEALMQESGLASVEVGR